MDHSKNSWNHLSSDFLFIKDVCLYRLDLFWMFFPETLIISIKTSSNGFTDKVERERESEFTETEWSHLA